LEEHWRRARGTLPDILYPDVTYRGDRVRRREFIMGLGGTAAWPVMARAQQAKMPVIGFLSSGRSDDFNDVVATFRKGLAESGFVEGQNVVIEIPLGGWPI
jgi:hypothetical protein